MRRYRSEKELTRILGAEFGDNDVIDSRIEQTYEILRREGRKKRKEKRRVWKNIVIGMGSVAAVFVLMLVLCAMNPVLAKEIPIIGSIFEKVADVFTFGKLPEEDSIPLYTEENDSATENAGSKGKAEETERETESPYRKKDGDVTITLTEQYASNQAIFIGVRVENDKEFPAIASYEDGRQTLQVFTCENYSFRPDSDPYCIDSDSGYAMRTIEGKFEDAHTFIGIMRIDYSDINVDERKYEKAYEEAQARGEDLWVTDENWGEYFSRYEVPSSFEMSLEIINVMGYLEEGTVPEGMKSGEELEQMSDEEWEAYMRDLHESNPEYFRIPNPYENWYQEGSWKYDIMVVQKDDASRVIELNQVNEDGIGIESIELSSVEMTMHTIEASGLTFAVALDADGNKLDGGSGNADEVSIAGHDISKIYIYICDYVEYMDEIKGYAFSDNGKSFQEVLEERALFKTVVETE